MASACRHLCLDTVAVARQLIADRALALDFGDALGVDKVTDIANFVLSLSGAPHDAAKAAAGAPEFAVCAACHGPAGEGNPALGAPKLADSIWTWGGGLAAVEQRINDGTHGVMPAWKSRLGADDARVIIAWLRSQARDRIAQP